MDDSHIFNVTTPVEIINGPGDAAQVSMSTIPIQPHLIESRRFLYPAFPATFLAPIAAVLVQWGAFEQAVADGLVDLKKVTGSTVKTPHTFGFKKSHFLENIRIFYADQPSIIEHVEAIFTEANDVYQRRNLLAHGELSVRMEVVNPPGRDMLTTDVVVSVVGEGVKKGLAVTTTFTVASLRSDFYKLANLGGRLEELFYKGSIPGLSPEGVESLQALQVARTVSDDLRKQKRT